MTFKNTFGRIKKEKLIYIMPYGLFAVLEMYLYQKPNPEGDFHKFFMQTWQRLMRDRSWPALSVSAAGSLWKD